MTDTVSESQLKDLAFQTGSKFEAAVKQYGLDLQSIKYLCESAVKVKSRAACRYSKFRVGAALLTKTSIPAAYVIGDPVTASSAGIPSDQSQASRGGPQIIVGVNVENASYPVGTCAERCAIGTAVALGHRSGDFLALAVNVDISPPASPCGMCRQFIREFCSLDMPVFMTDVKGECVVRTVEELLPLSFGPEQLGA